MVCRKEGMSRLHDLPLFFHQKTRPTIFGRMYVLCKYISLQKDLTQKYKENILHS